MSLICREDACCIYYCKKYTEKNAELYTERVDKLEDVDIRYTYDQNEPQLICESRIYGSPSLYKLYKLKEDLFKETNQQTSTNKSDIKLDLENDSQIVDFINYIYRPQMELLSDSFLYKLDYINDKAEQVHRRCNACVVKLP